MSERTNTDESGFFYTHTERRRRDGDSSLVGGSIFWVVACGCDFSGGGDSAKNVKLSFFGVGV
jgi:hypothetical protein